MSAAKGTLNVLDLFSGIGAFSLGLERAGMRTVAFCETNPFCRKVLKKHWPEVPCYEDVAALTADRLRADGIAVDVIAGGWPCQDISLAGKGAGIDGERSGLWQEYARIVRELRPRYVVMENVAALLGRGLERVLGDLAAIFYDAEGHCIPAASIGAPHLRDRVWIVAYPGGDALRDEQQRVPGRREGGVRDEGQAVAGDDGAPRASADAARDTGTLPAQPRKGVAVAGRPRGDMADTDRVGRERGANPGAGRGDESAGQEAEGRWQAGDDAAARRGGGMVGVAGRPRLEIGPRALREWAYAATGGAGGRPSESGLGGVVDGASERMDEVGRWGPGFEDGTSRIVIDAASKKNRRQRLAAIGNSLVPDIPQIIGEAIMKFEGLKK